MIVAQGELFGLLGPNGAGKTNSVKMLDYLVIPPVEQRVFWLWHQRAAEALRPRIGFIFGEHGTLLAYICHGYPAIFCQPVLHRSGYAKKRESFLLVWLAWRIVRMKKWWLLARDAQRLHNARALLHDPSPVPDEPTMELDPVGARELTPDPCATSKWKEDHPADYPLMFEADAICSALPWSIRVNRSPGYPPQKIKETVKDLRWSKLKCSDTTRGVGKSEGFTRGGKCQRGRSRSAPIADRHTPTALKLSRSCGKLIGLNKAVVTSREPTLEDAYVRWWGENDKSAMQRMKANLRVIFMAIRDRNAPVFHRCVCAVGIIVQPKEVAFMALRMLKDR